MPTFKATAIYGFEDSGLSWSVTNHLAAANPAAVLGLFNTWNDAYQAANSVEVRCKALRVSDVTVYRDIYEFTGTAINEVLGQVAGKTSENGTYAAWKGQGGAGVGGYSMFKLHGISQTLITSNYLSLGDALITALDSASLVWFQQYRPVAGGRLTTLVDPPAPFASGHFMPTVYFRRLGRPLSVAGQQRAYRRTAP